jgi:hypothetical protein
MVDLNLAVLHSIFNRQRFALHAAGQRYVVLLCRDSSVGEDLQSVFSR